MAEGSHPKRRLLGECTLISAASLGFACWLYRIWDTSLSLPFDNRFSDTIQITTFIKTIQLHGWMGGNPDLGAPFGSQFYDFPHAGESLQLFGVKFLALFIHDPGLLVNVYYLLGFPAVTLVSYLVLRHLRFRFAIAAPIALLYTFLPYHFAHGEGHIYRSSYISVPLACLLLLWTLAWRTRFLVDPYRSLRGWANIRANVRWPRVWAAVAIGVVVATTETMTLAFTLTAVAVACVLLALRQRDATTLAVGGIVIAVMGLTFALAMAPNLWYWHEHGNNPTAAARLVSEQERYGLQVSQMLLPIPDHRLATARRVQVKAGNNSPIDGEEGQELGVLGACGFLIALYGLIGHGLRHRDWEHVPVYDREQLWINCGLLTLILVLFASVSGLALILSLAGLSQVRDWNRAVILIGFFAMIVLGIGLEWLYSQFRARWRPRGFLTGRVLGGVALCAVLVFGLWDTAVADEPSYKSDARLDKEMSMLVTGIEHRLPKGSAVFQLPVVPFPENPTVVKLIDYDELRPYVHSKDLKWSYAGMKGRPEADWQDKVDSQHPAASLPGLGGLGFAGVLVDRNGYKNNGRDVVAELTAALGPPQINSLDGRLVFWELQGLAAQQGLSPAQLRAAAQALVGEKLLAKLPKPTS